MKRIFLAALLGLLSIAVTSAQTETMITIKPYSLSPRQFIPDQATPVLGLWMYPNTTSPWIDEVDVPIWAGAVRTVAVVEGDNLRILGQQKGYNAVNGVVNGRSVPVVQIKTQWAFLPRAKWTPVFIVASTDYLSNYSKIASVKLILQDVYTTGNTYLNGLMPTMQPLPVAVNSNVGTMYVTQSAALKNTPYNSCDITSCNRIKLGGWTVSVLNEPIKIAVPLFQIQAHGGKVGEIVGLRLEDKLGNVLADNAQLTSIGSLIFGDTNKLTFQVGKTDVFLTGILGSTFAQGGDETCAMNVAGWNLGQGTCTGGLVLPEGDWNLVSSVTKSIWGSAFQAP